MREMQTDVLVVGGGPVGLALAGELGWRGIRCTLVERSDGRVIQPKMDFVGVRTLEFCRRWGIVPWVHAAGYNRDYPQDCAWVSSLTGHEFGREVLPSNAAAPALPQSPYPRGERCPQNFLDPVLARFAMSFPTVTVRRRTEMLSFAAHDDGVSARIRDLDGGEDSKVRAAYLIGCDGGASPVRERLGIRMSGPPALTYTTNVIFRSDALERLHDKPPAYRFIFIGPEGTWATLVAINGRDQWRFSVVGDATRREPSGADMRELILRAVGREFDFEILSVLPWVRRQLVADSYGGGRVFIAGDAAHLTSPTGGFGMNMGIQDAVDLGWKLEAVLRGWGGPALLRAYEAERRPVAIRNVTEATGNLQRMLAPRDQRPPAEIFLPGAEHDAARRGFGDAYTEMMRREWFTPGIHLGFVYEGSPAIVPDGTPPPPDEVGTYTQTARPGSRAPHVWLAPERSTLDLFGRGFTLLLFGASDADAAPLVAAARLRGVPLTTVHLDHVEASELYARGLVLVRPDGHVAWRGDGRLEAAEALCVIDVVRGAGVSSGPADRGREGGFRTA